MGAGRETHELEGGEQTVTGGCCCDRRGTGLGLGAVHSILLFLVYLSVKRYCGSVVVGTRTVKPRRHERHESGVRRVKAVG